VADYDRIEMNAIDIHFHVVPSLFIDAVRRGDMREAVEIGNSGGRERFDFHPPAGVPVEPDTELQPEMYDEELILAALDKRKLSAAVLSPAPEMFMTWAKPDVAIHIAAIMNESMAHLCDRHPERLFGLAVLPLCDAEAAARELTLAVTELGLRGAALCTHVNGEDLDASRFDPLFAMAEQLNVPLFLHPQNFGDLRRLEDYHLWNMVGFPFETALTAGRLLLGGVFERHPNLRVILAHGGGFFPYQIGRLDHGWHKRPQLQEALPHPPSHYLKNIFCDSLVHDTRSLRFLVERLGFDHVVLGCDYPFGMGSDTPVDSLLELELPPERRDAILAGTLAKLLRITDRN